MASGLDRFRAREERRKESAAKRNIPFNVVEAPQNVKTNEPEVVVNKNIDEPIVQKSGKSRLLQFSC